MKPYTVSRFPFVFCCLTVWLAACSTDPVTTTTAPSNHALKAGDTFTYHRQQLDADGILIDGSDTTITAAVVSAGIQFARKSAVDVIAAGTDSTYFQLESDSSLSFWQSQISIINDVALPGLWTTLPVRPGTSIQLDSTVATTISGMPTTVAMNITSTFAGFDTVKIGSVLYPAIRTEKTVSVDLTITPLGESYTTVVTIEYRYVPKLGYMASKLFTTNSNSNYSPTPIGTVKDSLTSVTLH